MINSLKKILYGIVVLALSFIFSYYAISNKISPFGIAFVSALNYPLAPFGLIGASLGYLLSPATEIIPLRYIAALLSFAVIRGALKDNKRVESAQFTALASAFVIAITGFTIILSTRFSLSGLLLYIFEALLVGTAAYFLKTLSHVNLNGFTLYSLTAKESAALMVTGAMFILAFSKLTIFSITPILVVCPYIIMCVCVLGERYFGCFIGGMLALILSFGTGNLYILTAFVLGAILMSVFSPAGMIAVTLSNVVAAVISIPITEEIGTNIIYAIHILVGALLFILTPEFLAVKIEAIFTGKPLDLETSKRAEKIIGDKLTHLGNTISDVSTLLTKVFSATERMYPEDVSTALIREIITKQIEDTSNMIISLSEDIKETSYYDVKAQEQIYKVLSENDIKANNVICSVDSSGLMFIKFECPEPPNRTDIISLTSAIGEICEKSFELPTSTDCGEFIKVEFFERAALKIELGSYQITSKRSKRSGDCYTSFLTENGKFFMLLSDGMGTGSGAALGSALSVEVLSILLKEGLDFSCALSLANSAVMVNSADECLATVDLICIDTYTGKTDFYKAGAAATLVRHGHKISKLDRVALPIGILKNAEFSHSTAFLEPGDLILMSSDGIWVKDEERITHNLQYFKGDSMDTLAERISTAAFEDENILDDITVLAAKVCRR